jgi:uncharacterized protein
MIIGRKKEQLQLQRVLTSQQAEFLAIYGRRRVGKTYLIREFFQGKAFIFEAVGIKNAKLQQQLKLFMQSLEQMFKPEWSLKQPETWLEAFQILTLLIEKQTSKNKVILFFDELPWLASKRSGLIEALDYIWNKSWSQMNQVKLIVCGSAASWMLEQLVQAKGGLYNRVTQRMLLRPFDLAETKDYLQYRGLNFGDFNILEIYMAFGGVPFYLNYLVKGKSVSEQINQICFLQDAPLQMEFQQLFQSLFEHAEIHESIVRVLSTKKEGLSRKELIRQCKLDSGGTLKKRLDELEASCFIEKHVPLGRSIKDHHLKVVDEYTLFYLKWIEPMISNRGLTNHPHYWLNCIKSAGYSSWCGHAFESIVFKHIRQVIKALQLESVVLQVSSWNHRGKGEDVGAQIDLLMTRTDGAITLIEIKYSADLYLLEREEAQKLMRRMDTFKSKQKKNLQVFWVMVTPAGVKENLWAQEMVDGQVTLKDLMES